VSDIIDLHRRCLLGTAEAQLWSDRCASDARSSEPGSGQRFAIVATHALDNITALWQSRLPSIPHDGSALVVPRDRTHVGDYLHELRTEVTELENATNPDVDSSTKRMCRRIACEVDLLLEEANRLGVDL
jgi:hypothetical protein